jgi:hypothetical protein
MPNDSGKTVMTTNYALPGFAIKAVCISLAAAVLIVASTVLLTVFLS